MSVPVISEAVDVVDSILNLLGIQSKKWFKDTDFVYLMDKIRNSLLSASNLSSNVLQKIENKMNALMMLPLTGQMKTVVMKARSSLQQKGNKIRNLVAAGDAAKEAANILADDLSNTSLGSRIGNEYQNKKAQLDAHINAASKAYDEAAELGKDI